MPSGTSPDPEEHAAASRRLSGLIGAYQTSAAIGALARLSVADALSGKTATAGELAAWVGAGEDALARLLDATLDAGLFTRDENGRYGLTAQGELLRTEVPGSLRRFAIVSTEDWRWNAYAYLAHTLRTGEPGFVRAHNCRLWDYLGDHPEAAVSFEESMARIASVRDRAVVSAVDFSGFNRVIDVGGGRGGLLCALLSTYTGVQGMLFDLPGVVEGAGRQLRQAGLEERCDVVAGDFREAVPPGGDAYLLSWILHDWDDVAAQSILRRCRQAMQEGAVVLLVGMVVPEENQPGAEAFRRLVRQTDLEMLAVVGGRERRIPTGGEPADGAGCADILTYGLCPAAGPV